MPAMSRSFRCPKELAHVAPEKETRKSIKKYYPLGAIKSQGRNNPITLHSVVSETLFAYLWSLMGEVMVVDGQLPWSTKEAIALLISSKNECPMCVNAHRMMGKAAARADKKLTSNLATEEKLLRQQRHLQAMDYAEIVVTDTLNFTLRPASPLEPHTDDRSKLDKFPLLTHGARAEVGLLVLLFCHLNRIISAILGEQMSNAMFSVPKFAAKRMEAPSVMKVIGNAMAPMLQRSMEAQRQPGLTNPLFPQGYMFLNLMPEHLEGAILAGVELASALERLYRWSREYEGQLLQFELVSPSLLAMLDDPAWGPPEGLPPSNLAIWANTDLPKRIRVGLAHDVEAQEMANVLFLVSYSPQSVYHSPCWYCISKRFGDDQAKAIVVWCSLRESLKRAQGLRMPK